jgi:hypothetical protein
MRKRTPMPKRTPEPYTVIDPKWIDVLEELDKKLLAKQHTPLLQRKVYHDTKGWVWEPMDLSELNNEDASYLELTAIASTKSIDALSDVCGISYEEDEDCDYAEIENRVLRTRKKYWTFEVGPLDRNHPQTALRYGFITAENYEAAKAELIAVKDCEDE